VLAGFKQARIEPLEPKDVETFLDHLVRQAAFPDSATQRKQHRAEMAEAVRGSAEIRRLARNPVMLTALAVGHWNKKRLPEQCADLVGEGETRRGTSEPGCTAPTTRKRKTS